MYDAWNNIGTYHDFPLGQGNVPITCWSIQPATTCSHHLRSRLIDLWDAGQIQPQQVSNIEIETKKKKKIALDLY